MAHIIAPPPHSGRHRSVLRLPGTPAWHRRSVILNYGLGWDSTAILLRWLQEPASRDFALEQLIVVIAHVGEEFTDSQLLVEGHIFPLLRLHRIRTVQIARRGPSDKDGIVVLSDTRQPTTLHIAGAWRLGDHMMRDGTVPQYANGRHFCAQRFKGWPIGQWLRGAFKTRPYRSIIGYHADEPKRAAKAADYADIQRAHEFPLMRWGWGRAAVEAYVRRATGVEWAKSCCGFCPFACGRAEMVARLTRHPEQGVRALVMEHLSLSLNPRFGLYPSGKPLRVTMEQAHAAEVLTSFARLLDDTQWSLYRVRRMYRAQAPLVDRSVKRMATGDRAAMLAQLRSLGDTEVEGGIARVSIRRRAGRARPAIEEFYVAAPAIIGEKEKKCFSRLWTHNTSGVKQIALTL